MSTNTNFQHGLQTSDLTASGTITCNTLVANTEIIDVVVEDSISVGSDGTAGTFQIFPATTDKGKLALAASDSAGDTITTITNASQAAARTYTIPDAGASTTFVMAAGNSTIAGTKTFSSGLVLTGTQTGTYTLGGTPTITAPILSGSVTGTYTLAGTPTLTSPTINGAILSIAASRSGTFVANGVTPVSVTNANVTANSVIVITLKTVGGTVGATPHVATITPTTGFTTVGDASDTSTYNYTIIS